MHRFRTAASDDWSDNASPSTSEDCGANSPKDEGFEKRFVLYPDRPNPAVPELNTQRRQSGVTLLLHDDMTEADIRQLLMTEFKDLRETSFEFLTRDNIGRENNCPCKNKCRLKYEDGHPSAEWNARNIRSAAKSNRTVYIRKTPVVEAGSSASSNFTQATKRLCTGETKHSSEDRTYPVSSSGERSEVSHLFSELDINYNSTMVQDMKEVEEVKSSEGNCTRDTPDSAYSSMSAECSTAASAASFQQTRSEEQIDHEQEATSSLTLLEQERKDMEEIMKPVLGEISHINPPKGDITGGYPFIMLVKSCISLCGLETSDGLFAKFGESKLVKVSLVNPYSVEGYVPAGTKTGRVFASLYFGPEENLQLVGVISFEYTDENDPANVARLLENQLNDEAKMQAFLMFHLARRSQGNRKLNTGTSAYHKEKCENDRTEAMSLLRIIVETAAKINAMKFFSIIFSTPVARSVFKCFKDEQVRLEEVAREYGNEELACFLEEKHKMYQPDENDSDDEVDWKALSTLAAEYQRRNAGSIETGVVVDATSSESSQGYDGDLETSSSDSSDLQSNIGDHLEEAVGEPDTTSNSNSEEIKLDSDEQTVEPESRQQEEEPKFDDLIEAPRKQLTLALSVEEKAYEESDEPDPPPPYPAPASHAEVAYHLCAQEISQQDGSIADSSQGHQDQAVTTFGPAPRKQLSLAVSVEENAYEESDEPDPPPPYFTPACSPPQGAYHFGAQEYQQSVASVTDSGQGHQEETVTTFDSAPRKQLSLAVSEEQEDYAYSGEPEPSPPYSTPACSAPQVAYHFCAQESQQSMASVTDSGQGHLEQTVTKFDSAPRKQLSLAVSVEENAYEESDEPDPPPPYFTPACSPPQGAYHFGAQESQQSVASVTDSGQGHQEETVTTFDSAPRKHLSHPVSVEEVTYDESNESDPPPPYSALSSLAEVAYHFGSQESPQSMASVTDAGQGHQEQTVTTFGPVSESSGARISVGKVSQDELSTAAWERLGEGGFSSVFKAKLKGNDVAVKVLKNLEETKPLLTEGNLLRDLRHDNIVAFRGMNILENDIKELGLRAGSPFLVMEYIPKNLYRFVEDHRTPESQGLPKSQVWTLAREMANGLMYLHSLNPPISHRDLKPDNILLDIRSLRAKLADFSLSITVESSGTELSLFHARWTAPEVWDDYIDDRDFEDTSEEPAAEKQDYTDLDDELFYLRADVYSYGQLVAYTLTGTMPWQGRNSVSVKGIENDLIKKEDKVEISEELKGKLKDIINDCRLDDPEKRPTAGELVLDERYFAGDPNPYQAEVRSAEFFSCGFLQHTAIFVAESLVDEVKN